MGIKVLLADDHSIVRAGLRRIVEESGDMQVIAEAADGRQAVALVEQTRYSGWQPVAGNLQIACQRFRRQKCKSGIMLAHMFRYSFALTGHLDRDFPLAFLTGTYPKDQKEILTGNKQLPAEKEAASRRVVLNLDPVRQLIGQQLEMGIESHSPVYPVMPRP